MADYLLDTNHASKLPIPPLDAQIAAVARVQGLTLLTADRQFQFIDHLTVENWLI